MKFLDLFAGVGGIRLGMEQAGHECVGWVEWDKFARKSYVAIHKPDGEFTEKDINNVVSQELPKADCWCFGFPCQDISLAGKQGGFTNGKRSSLFFTVTGLIRQLKEEDRPSYLFIENVKNLLSINKGWDFAKLLIEMDEIGYDVEWDVLDSAEVVPQHRERIFIIGHLRGRSTRKVFPIIREDGNANKPDKSVNQIGNISNSKSFGGNPQTGRVYGTDGIALTLSTMQGGGLEPKIAIREATKKGYAEAIAGDSVNISQPNSKTRRGRVGKQLANTLETSLNQGVVIPTLTPDRVNKRQNGRRFKEDGDPEFTLTAQDRHGIYNGLRIRKLTPKECWRLQGFPDWAFDKAQEVNSNSQLYKQAGNSVTVPVIKAIAEKLSEEEK